MEDKIEVGEYVILHYGKIDRVKNNDYYMQEYIECEKGLYPKENIKKHSKNIIDLIEEGDYINGERVFKIEKDPFVKGQTDIFFNRDEVNYWGDKSLSQITDKDIKLIVTKEMMESIEYRVE